MIASPHRNRILRLLLAGALPIAAGPAARAAAAEPVTELEAFIVTETARHRAGDLMPTSRPLHSDLGAPSVLDVPRSVTVVTRELMARFGLDDFSDLGRVGAGTQQINYYGVPGTPSLRGARGGVYFLGLQRAYQRNEMPLSFGSLEAMDVVKGPAPAHFGPGQAGGYVNAIPKAPFFDRARGSIQLEIGSHRHRRLQLDAGGPFLLGERPAAYRVSVTGQLADAYYDRIGNDYLSVYGSLQTRLAPAVTLFAGGEYFRFRSNENAGWNRPTQALVDRGEYIIGEPLSIVSPAWGGVADRSLLRRSPALVVPAAVVGTAVARGRVTAAQRDALLDLADPADRARAYAVFTPAELSGLVPSTSGYQYTPAYFEAGGEVFTTTIAGHQVLSDERDHADSENLLAFAEIVGTGNPARTIKGQFLLDAIETDKLSSYGYAIRTRQRVLEARLSARESPGGLGATRIVYGISARFTDARMLQDFFDEPFSRRDVSLAAVSANSRIPTGPETDPDGVNFWSPTAQGGANAHSRLWQLSAFGEAETRFGDRLTTHASALVAHAPYSTRYPGEVDRVAAGDPRRARVSDARGYYSVSLSPVLALAPGVNAYATVQYGTALDPLQGGAIVGRGNFARNRLQEAGLKASLLEGRLFASLAGYSWRQSQFDERANDAELLEGRGLELEFTWRVARGVTLIGSANHQVVRRLSDLGFRSIPLTEQQIALRGGVLNTPFSGLPPRPGLGPYGRPARNPDLEYPGTPREQFKLFLVWARETGFGLSGGPVWSAATWHNFDRTIRLPESLVWQASVFYRARAVEVALSVENVTGEDYFLGAEPVFGANTLVTKAPGPTGTLRVTMRY